MLAEYESLLACVPKSARECGTRQGKKLLPKGNLTVALSEEMVRTLLYLMSHEQGFTAGGGTAVPWNQVAKLNNSTIQGVFRPKWRCISWHVDDSSTRSSKGVGIGTRGLTFSTH